VSAHPFSDFAWSGVFSLFSLASWGMYLQPMCSEDWERKPEDMATGQSSGCPGT